MPFKIIKEKCPTAIYCNSKYWNFWSVIKDFEYEEGRTLENIAKITFRIYPIPLSESGAERSFSDFGWRFNKRRSRLKRDTMINEVYIENSHKQKVQSSEDFTITMWKVPKFNDDAL